MPASVYDLTLEQIAAIRAAMPPGERREYDLLTAIGDGGYRLPGHDQPWRQWLADKFPRAASAALSPRHEALWDWFDGIQAGVWQRPRVEIWPRGGAKSASAEIGLARLASKLARRFALIVSDNQDQADTHVQSAGTWLQDVGAEPALNRMGRAKAWRRDQIRTANGFNLAGFGVDSGQRGIRIDEYRPDIIIFDDVDSRHDSPLVVAKKIECITQSIMPTGAPHCVILFVENLVHANSIASQLVSERANFLLDRDVATVEPAVEGLEVEQEAREGRKPIYHITAGRATWEGQPLAVCEKQINEWGYETFLREAQHEVRAGSSFFDQFDELRHVIQPPYTPNNPPPRWWTYYGGMDWGYAAPFAFTLRAVDEKGCKHSIESVQATRLTNEQQAVRIVSMLASWGIEPRRCLIGYDETMSNRPSLNGIAGEAPIEAFTRAGLTCVGVKNTPTAQAGGFSAVREQLLVPGDPSPAFTIWAGFNADLIYSVGAATHDRLEPEKLTHDECSHLVQAMRYSEAPRPKTGIAPAVEKSIDEQYAETNAAFAAAALAKRNRHLGLTKAASEDGSETWVARKGTKKRPLGV